ncbi:(2Fe-2S)-binding protein [Tsukamurella tyrosinosolvens]|uniref:(2Fe-2S)-binding protein n=1 Tax=Tsukamurella tyrosinosolvens TaxID=57704 RepID=UPI000DF6E05E|nr:(2Fe-2S)-binding protein [Tsukamurella tyrosinosolvens]RDB49147.1 Fe-S oxidoreductase [Tsukamurella tyrosinosolvens]
MIAELRRSVAAPDDRVAGVLYWYALSGALARLAVAGRDASSAVIRPGPGGWPDVGEAAPSAGAGADLARACHRLIPALAAESGAAERALWAIATDSIASAALDTADPRTVADELLHACGPEAPAARFEEVPGRGTVVRRGSCCLLYLCPGMTKCLSCPRQTPGERRARLA